MVSGERSVERTFVIAEAGVNHDGSLDKALRLVDIAVEAGADAVKFQTFRTDEVVTPDAAKAAYQQRQTGAGTQYEMIRALELDDAAHERLARHCAERGIEFMSTPFAPWAVDMLLGLGMRRIKIASGEIVNKPLIDKVAGSGRPIILSTGMAEMAEVVRAVDWIRTAQSAAGIAMSPGDLVVLHCTSEYPAPAASVNLRAMDTLAAALDVPVGYSDHSLGIEIAVAAVARGAAVIEKHFTENSRDHGPDHAASLEPAQLRAMVDAIRNVEVALGDGVKRPAPLELPTRALVRRSAFALTDINRGDRLDATTIAFLRPGDGIGPERADWLFARTAARDIARGSKLCEDDIG
ncbi:N-acetylneuraminate synthase [Sphingopyxis alaskensis]|jgi:N,N'-diacetyllegionaminate synthase|uniref:N-acetylneuraminate synthase n=1 Tax=Sphingopyxis alaskensis (strain DSM 13593 / LMG 18877 / RB2256) TaxID=317655 RepID=Q1GST3_SPHAL|nr:N-acetylneuraminate synthase [Sphingopyxis alaskensis]ABF53289.1 N-acetylneuraminate synthase [Sphingopyxis alaskensis RB2256]MCM3418709.1 N-acetylneuraminate synthase [Sphingopyxis alaskensis]